MKYCDLRPAIEAYAEGRNVTAVLRELLGEGTNTSQIIEIAYELQAGSYIEDVRRAPEQYQVYFAQLSEVLSNHISAGDRVLEVGAGEMTTLTGVANSCYKGIRAHYAMDISWSRIRRGRDYVANAMRSELAAKLHDFVADMFHLPLRDKSIDVIWTSHALEPNGGREREILMELFRVARKRIILFEPSYENNSAAGRARMEMLGYVRGLPDAIADVGGRIESMTAIRAFSDPPLTPTSPLNPTYAYVVAPPHAASAEPAEIEWACPTTGLAMTRRDTCFWSENSMLAYPIIGGIPVLRPEAAVFVTALD